MFNLTTQRIAAKSCMARSLTIRCFASGDNFKFPKHKNLFTEDYYNKEDNELSENPYAKHQGHGSILGNSITNDFEDFNEPVHRATQSGLLSTYKKQINLTAQDVMERDYWNNV